MKTTLKIIFSVLFVVGFIGIFMQNADGSAPVLINLSSIALCAVSGKAMDKLGMFNDNE